MMLMMMICVLGSLDSRDDFYGVEVLNLLTRTLSAVSGGGGVDLVPLNNLKVDGWTTRVLLFPQFGCIETVTCRSDRSDRSSYTFEYDNQVHL